jgi:hypothetical protein
MRLLRILVSILLLSSLGLLVFTYTKINDLPSEEELVEQVYKEPVQEEVDLSVESFEVIKDGFSYKITPTYHYEISGILVADYRHDSWLNMFKKKDPLYKRDVCLIWGYNVESGNYKKGSFTHRDEGCIWQADEDVIFNQNEMSENRLLPSNDKIENTIKQAKIGDQISAKGYLVNYQVLGLDLNFFVNTSSSREDKDLEVIYVTEFNILAEDRDYKFLHRVMRYVSAVFLVIYVIIYFSYIEKKPAIKKKEVIPELDTDPMKQKSFPSVFHDRD